MQFEHLPTPQPYLPLWQRMQQFVANRTSDTEDQIWFCEHDPVFTLGQAGKEKHILNAHSIPVVKSDRGGQVTYHGPGYLMVYCLFDLKRLGFNTRELVCKLENIIIELLASYKITAYADRDAPGVYVEGAKIASLGLRISKGYTYHGLCINVDGDLTPFSYINPCGIEGQTMTSLSNLGINTSVNDVAQKLTALLNNLA